MKRFTLITIMLLIFAVSYGQKVKTVNNHVPYSKEVKMLPIQKDLQMKAEGEVFYSETFDFANPADPKGYTLPQGFIVTDESDNGFFWVWRAGTDSIKGRYTFEPGHIYSKTPEDGYFVLPMDEYNWRDNVFTQVGGTAWFQFPPIDCSGRSSVIMKYRQNFRACCGAPNVKILISLDEGLRWSTIDSRYETAINIHCIKPIVEVNITDIVAGMPNVWIRFQWNDNSHYYWAIDDFELSEGYMNELQLDKPWLYLTDLTAEDSDEGFFYMVPLAQTGTNNFGGYTFEAAFLNAGMEDQSQCYLNAEVFKNGVSVYNENSAKRDMWTLSRDTFAVTTPFNPDGYGNYKMVLTAKQNETDGVPANNVYTDTYYVTDSIYSISDWEWESHSSTAGHGNNDGDWMGIVYDINKATQVNSISCAIMQRSQNPQASTQVGYSFQFWLFKWNVTNGEWMDLMTSDFAEVEQDMINSWVTMEWMKDGESEFLEPGYYIAAIQVFHGGGAGADNNTYRFTIGSDMSHRYAPGKTVYRLYNDESWYINEDCSMIRLNLDDAGAPSEADVIFNVDMTLPITNGYFNPGSDFLDVAGSFNGWSGSAHMADPDGDGIYSLTVPGFPIFEIIEYKYRINSNWNTSEFPSGGPNRVYRTTFYNNLADVYNNGISMGIEPKELQTSLNVYPNPTEGIFNLEIANVKPTDLHISVMNLQGQLVYHRVVKSALNFNEPIDLTSFARGMYFLKVNDQVLKLVVK
ncbi:MAG: T9SS type A sorting domain-containing protein [Bacteroidales bacterium]